jgi:exosortase/archaeosortase family protein
MEQKITKQKFRQIKQKIEPFEGILLFAIALFAANLLWKLLIWGDDSQPQVLLCNRWDITPPFYAMVMHIADVVRAFLHFLDVPFHAHAHNDILFSSKNGILIVWGCTAIKQSFIFLCIMLISKGLWKRKLWYIPLGLLAIYLFNIFRITLIAIITNKHPELFGLLHLYVFKYLFYGFIFMIWVLWEEKVGRKS